MTAAAAGGNRACTSKQRTCSFHFHPTEPHTHTYARLNFAKFSRPAARKIHPTGKSRRSDSLVTFLTRSPAPQPRRTQLPRLTRDKQAHQYQSLETFSLETSAQIKMARSIPTFHLKAAAHEQSCAQETHLPTETTTQASSHATPTNPSPTAKISAALAIQLSSPAIAVAIPAFEAENPPLSSKLAQIKALMRDQRKKPAADSTTTGSSSSTPSPVLEGTKTPSTSTSSEPPRAPSPPKGKVCAKWTDDKWSGVAKEAHYKRTQVFGRTRQMMRDKSRNMIVMASRGYGRSGHVPTKFTKPRLHKRRYSVDVLTLNRDGIIDGPPAKGTNIEVCYFSASRFRLPHQID